MPLDVNDFDRLLQVSRLLSLHFPNADGPDSVLAVDTLTAREELSRSFRFDVGLLSDDSSIPLKDLLGKKMTVSLVRDDGTERHFNGYVTEFRYVKTDGGFARYHAVLEPWLAFARLRKDCASFKGTSLVQLTETTFANYPQRDWKTQLRGADPQYSCINQYNETDYNHLHRRWEAVGLHYWYEHRADGHTLCLSDDSAIADPVDACGSYDVDAGTIPYRAYAGAFERDGIHQWQAVRRVGSSGSALASFDYKVPMPHVAKGFSENRQGEAVPALELYEDAGEYGFPNEQEGESLARRRMEEANRMTQYFDVAGNDRCVQPGRSFRLAGHHSSTMQWPAGDYLVSEPIRDRDYLITAVQHSAANNIRTADHEPSFYRNEFTCLRKTVKWRPGRYFNSTPPPAPGVQTAIVTGPPGEEIYTDGYGRVKIQFHWDRQGGNDENSSAWVRVAMPMAGGELGQIGLPRVKQEVVVQFLGGNPDRPIITGVVYNERHRAPWELPGQRALSGLRSRELGGTRRNQLVLDDTNGQIQAQLRSDHLHSQLSLGTIHRLESTAGHKEARGEGFELRTDGHGVARAARGLLLTTESRTGGAGAVKAMTETSRRLAQAHERHNALAQLAQQYDDNRGTDQSDATTALKAQNDGIQGSGDKLPELTAPHVVLSSSAGIAATAGQSIHVTGGEQIALTAGANVSIGAQGGLFASVRQGLRLFVHKIGMKLIVASGKVEIRAETDEVEIVAQKVLRLISDADWIELRGRKGIRLHGAGSMIEIADKVQVFSQSPTLFHCNFETLGPQNRSQPSQRQPKKEASTTSDQPTKLRPLLQPHSAVGQAYANTPYILYKNGTEMKVDLTDEEGRAEFDYEPGAEYKVRLGNGDDFALNISDDVDAAKPGSEKSQSNQGYRAMNDATDGRDHKN
ncbi:type VI secretion system secreted protein VgrG [Pseudoduganella lurida]|uniref:Type VI secretion system secreted protein VgrG n=1 Tax=Pseudoduganella lurida TaxID=1036180 RepID=A0A562QW12_9BURK|nr:type VI secretion system Vgr family protein [Pseudoduganella lurida]TWI60947.1 type VI secretion system secreted protein VgrG [Pseudoduganella lurida]